MALFNTTTQQEFDEKVLKSNKVVLVDFWAEWCPPCRAMAPILHDLATDMDRDVDVVKVDVEASPDNAQLASQHHVQGIPNMQMYKNGKVVDTIIGMVPKPHLEDTLLAHIAKKSA